MKKRAKKVPPPKADLPRLAALCRTWTHDEHEAARLKDWARQLLGIPHGAKGPLAQARLPLRPLVLSDAERMALAGYLQKLAATPAALKAMTTRRTRRGRPAQAARAWRIALDYLLTQERLGNRRAKVALGEVGDAWGLGRSSVLAALQACESRQGWVEWATYELRQARADNPDMHGDELLLKISSKLRSPENSR